MTTRNHFDFTPQSHERTRPIEQTRDTVIDLIDIYGKLVKFVVTAVRSDGSLQLTCEPTYGTINDHARLKHVQFKVITKPDQLPVAMQQIITQLRQAGYQVSNKVEDQLNAR